jgi:tripartite-type tricarboxylate transporter receptor subunit TctC
VVEQLRGALETAMQNPSVKDVLLRDGADITVSKPEEFRQVIENDYAKYGKLADLLKSAK